MIFNETFKNNICISADIIDLEAKTYTREEMGTVVEGPRMLTSEEWLTYGPQPLNSLGSLTTLLVVEGVLPITDAANAIGLTPDQLITEAKAWFYIQEGSQP